MEAARLTATIDVESKTAESDMKRFHGTLGNAASGFERLIATAGGFVLGGAIVGGIHLISSQFENMVSSGADANRELALLSQGLKSTHDASGQTVASLDALSTSIMNNSGIDDDATKSAEQMLLTFTGLGKDVFPQVVQATADMATRMNGGAIPSAQQMNQTALQLGKALNDPVKGLTMLTREGVTFTDQQKAQITAMEKAGNTAGAQKIMLAELNKEFGGSAAAAGQANGGIAILTAQFDNMKQSIGQAVIPILLKLMQAVLPLTSAFSTALPAAISTVQGFFTQWAPVLDQVKTSADFLGHIFMDTLQPALDQVGAALSKASGPGLSVQGVLKGVANVTQQLAPFVQQVARIFGQLGLWFVSTGLPALQQFGQFVQKSVLPILGQLGGFIVTTMLPALGNLGNFIVTNVVPAVEQIVTWFGQKVMPILTQVAGIVVTNVVPALESMWTTVSTQLIPAIQNLWNKLSPVLIPVFQFLAGPVLGGLVVPAFKFTWGAVSLVITILGDLIGAIGWVLGKLGNLKDFLGGALSAAWHGLGDVVSGVWDGISGAVKGGINAIIQIIDDMISKINSIHIDIPQVGPVGGGHIGFNIPLIPQLAKGGDVSGLFVGAEQGPELITRPGVYNAAPGSHVLDAQTTAKLLGTGKGGDTYNIYPAKERFDARDMMTLQRRHALLGTTSGGY